MSKKLNYEKDGQFDDPVVRCCDCKMVIHRNTVKTLGMCPSCGNRRVRNVLTLSEKEMEDLKEKGVDPEFLGLFEGVEDAV